MSVTAQPIKADQLVRMPGDGFRFELVKGELRKRPFAGNEHGRIAINVTVPLATYAKGARLGRVYATGTGFLISSVPDTVRAPDVAYVSQEKLDEIGEIEGFLPCAPDLVIEVISPSDTYGEVEEKVFDWLAAGSRMVIVVNPRKRTITVYRTLKDITVLTENDQLDGGDVVPGWTIAVRDVFA